jgi:anti-sigma regulatory factor (Ser/Thr protein kinase)/ActR/RegA family two-component response regulator
MSVSAQSEPMVEGSHPAARVLLIGDEAHRVNGLEEALTRRGCLFDSARNAADALQRLRLHPYGAVITDPSTGIDQDLDLVEQIRRVRPDARIIILAPRGTAVEILATLRRRVFLCACTPIDAREIANFAVNALEASSDPTGIEVLSGHPDWLSVRMHCDMLNADRLIAFLRQLQATLPQPPPETLMTALREILRNAIEHGAKEDATKLVEVAAVHTPRSMIFYISDPGKGFRRDNIPHAAISNTPDDPARHLLVREQAGMAPGGYGILMARGIVDELVYSEIGNEVMLVKYLE